MVMPRMAGRVPGFNFDMAHADTITVVEARDTLRRCRQNVAPEFLHSIPIDARGAVDELRWINDVRSTPWMHKHLRSLLRPPACCAGVIQVNVGHEDFADVLRFQAKRVEAFDQRCLT